MQTILKKKNKGFTMVELVVVIAIIGILVLLAMPKFMDYTKDAKDSKTQHNARVAEDAVTEYLVGNDDKLPEDLAEVTPEEIQDAIDEGRAYGPEGPVAEVPEGPYVDVTDLEEVKAGGIKTDGRIISNSNGDVFILLDKAIRTDICVLRADQKMYVASYVFYGNVDSTTYSSPNYENAEAVKAKYPTAEFYKFTEDGKSFIGFFTNNDKKTREVTLVDYYGDGISVIVPGEVAVKVDSHTTDVHTVIASDVQNVIDPSAIVFQLPCTVTGTMISGDAVEPAPEPTNTTCFTYEVKDGMGIVIQDYLDTDSEGNPCPRDVVIPNEIEGEPVARIGYKAFYSKNLDSVILPNTLIDIKSTAFSENNLTELVLPEGLQGIAGNAFEYNQLTDLVIPDSVEYVSGWAFSYNQLENVHIGTGLGTRPSDYGIKSVGCGIFHGNDNLNPLTVDVGNPNIVSSSTAIYSKDGKTLIMGSVETANDMGDIEIIGQKAFNGLELTSITIPNTVTTIETSAFTDNNLTNVTIPDSVTTIEDSFLFDTPLDTITIGNSVETLGDYALQIRWSDHPTLESVYAGAGTYYFAHNGWYDAPNTPPPLFTFTTITDGFAITGLTEAGKETFSDALIIPATIGGKPVLSIGARAFWGSDYNFTSVDIPNSVVKIGDLAFADNNLQELILPNSVTSIGFQSFIGNSSLSTVKMSESIVTIGDISFANCNITEIILPSTLVEIGYQAFQNNQLTEIIIPDSVTTMGDSAFYGNKLTSIILGSSLAKLEVNMFAENNLTSFSIPTTITEIEHGVFRDNNLTSITIPDSVISIGSFAFARNNLSSITIPNSVKVIDVAVFEDNELTSITMHNAITNIGSQAFNRNSLTSVTIPTSVTTIDNDAFASNGLGSNSYNITTKPYAGTWELIGTSRIWTKQ